MLFFCMIYLVLINYFLFVYSIEIKIGCVILLWVLVSCNFSDIIKLEFYILVGI